MTLRPGLLENEVEVDGGCKDPAAHKLMKMNSLKYDGAVRSGLCGIISVCSLRMERIPIQGRCWPITLRPLQIRRDGNLKFGSLTRSLVDRLQVHGVQG